PNYLSTDEDRKIAAESLRLTRRIVSQPALAAFKPEEYKPGPQYQTDADLARLAGDIATTIFHPVGTCKMGRPHDPMAVV
ncbi:GMC oxidoreductase, partial [Acinetobacter baumannii]